MNKDLMDQIPAEEQPVALKINSLIETMQPSEGFQWDLESQLMDKATTTQPARGWFTKIAIPVGWGLAAIVGVLLLSWTIRSFSAQPPSAAISSETQEVSFADSVHNREICTSPLALAHGFDVFLTNEDKTGFVALDKEKSIGELRSFTWSPDGERLTIVGNTTGSGRILITDPAGGQREYLLSGSGVGYLMDAAWSRDGKQLAMWSSQKNTILYLVSADGNGLVEKQLDLHLLGAPQFAPDGQSILFHGAEASSAGLFEVRLDNTAARLISSQMENENAFAFSPDGSQLAYVEMDRDAGEARLVTQELSSGNKITLGILSIPKGSGSSIPEAANLSWSANGKSLVFDFGRYPTDHAIYLARADGTAMVKVVDSAYAPSISTDGKCLAYISEGQVFIKDLTVVFTSTAQPPVSIADLPAGRGIPNFKQDKLQWRP